MCTQSADHLIVLLSFTCDWDEEQWQLGSTAPTSLPHSHKTYIFHTQLKSTLTKLTRPSHPLNVLFETEMSLCFSVSFYLSLSPSTSSCLYNKCFSTFLLNNGFSISRIVCLLSNPCLSKWSDCQVKGCIEFEGPNYDIEWIWQAAQQASHQRAGCLRTEMQTPSCLSESVETCIKY